MPGPNPYIAVPVCFGGQRADLDIKDIPPKSMSYSRNWMDENGVFRTRNGMGFTGTSMADTPLAITQYEHNDGNIRTVVGTSTKWFNWSIANLDWVDITDSGNPLTGSFNSVQNFRSFYKAGVCYLVGVNDTNAPKKWDGTSAAYADIGGSPPKAQCLMVLANRLLLGNIYYGGGQHPCDVDVSGFNDFETGWNGATQITSLADTSGPITEMREFGNLNGVIYKTDSIYVATAQSATYPFSFQLAQANVRGPANGKAVVSTPTMHYFLSPDCNVYSFNMYQATPLSKAIQAHIFATADLSNLGLAFGYYRSQKNELRFVYVGKDGSYQGIRIHLDTATIWPDTWNEIKPSTGMEATIQLGTKIGDLVLTISHYTSAISTWRTLNEFAILCDSGGQAYENNPLYVTDQGTPIIAELVTGMVAQNDARRYFSPQESEHFFDTADGDQTVSVYLGVSQSGESPVYDEGQIIDISTNTPHRIGHRANSRMFSLNITAIATHRIQWRGSQINGIPRGYR